MRTLLRAEPTHNGRHIWLACQLANQNEGPTAPGGQAAAACCSLGADRAQSGPARAPLLSGASLHLPVSWRPAKAAGQPGRAGPGKLESIGARKMSGAESAAKFSLV